MPRAAATSFACTALSVLVACAAVPANAEERPADAAPPQPERARVLLLELASNGVEANVVRTVEGLLAVELSRYDAVDVLTSADIRRAVELETQRQVVGCDDSTCLSELAGALGADLVIYGDAGKLGSLLVVNLSLFDQSALRSIGRVSVRAETLERLPDLLRPKLADLLAPWYAAHGIPLERPALVSAQGGPPAFVPWTIAGAGGVLVVVGAVLGGVGAQPWLSFERHATSLAALEQDGASTLSSAREAYAAQEEARDAWERWGGPLVVSGAVTVGVGLASAAAGVAWALLSSEGASE